MFASDRTSEMRMRLRQGAIAVALLVVVRVCLSAEHSLPNSQSAVVEEASTINGQDVGTVRTIAGIWVAATAWACAVLKFAVDPFYSKKEQLHKDYWVSGELSSAIARLESELLIPSLARMFNLATDAQSDKRKRPEREIEQLLQSVAFGTDLNAAQNAMSQINAIKQTYTSLQKRSSVIWRFGALNALFTLILPGLWIWGFPQHRGWEVAFWALATLWCVTALLFSVRHHQFGNLLETFIDLIEVGEIEVTE